VLFSVFFAIFRSSQLPPPPGKGLIVLFFGFFVAPPPPGNFFALVVGSGVEQNIDEQPPEQKRLWQKWSPTNTPIGVDQFFLDGVDLLWSFSQKTILCFILKLLKQWFLYGSLQFMQLNDSSFMSLCSFSQVEINGFPQSFKQNQTGVGVQCFP